MKAYYVPVTLSCMIKCPFSWCDNTVTIVFRLTKASPKPSLKIRTARAFFWIFLGIFRDYGLNFFFLGIKLFCFSRYKAEIFSNCLKYNFVKPHKILKQSDKKLKKIEIKIIWMSWMSWNFVRFHDFFFQTDAESFSFLSWKKKILKKIWSKL